MTALTQEQFEERMVDVPEGAFRDLVTEIMEAFGEKEGIELDRIQVAALTERLLAMSETIESQVNYIGELQEEVERCKKQSKIWTPE